MGITIAEVKSARLSDDRKEVIVAGKGKYIGDFDLCVGVECLDQMIGALARARSELAPTAAVSPAAAPASPAASPANGFGPTARNGGSDPNSNGPNPNQVRCDVPKNCTVADGRGVVFIVLNHRLEDQRGYALPPDAAKALGARLMKSADAVLAQGPASASAQGPRPVN